MPWEKSLNSEISTVVAGYLSAVVMKDDVSSGCCLFVQLRSSSHTYIAENVHDNNLCLYPFIMLVVDPLLPENVFFPLQFQSSFTYAILIFCIQFTLFYLLFTQSKTQKYLFYKTRILSCYLERYLALLFQYLIQELLDFRHPAPCGIDTLISKLATNDLCTCSHQGIFWCRCRGAKRCRSFYFCLFILVLLIFVLSYRFPPT